MHSEPIEATCDNAAVSWDGEAVADRQSLGGREFKEQPPTAKLAGRSVTVNYDSVNSTLLTIDAETENQSAS
jgi:hypothetical protein